MAGTRSKSIDALQGKVRARQRGEEFAREAMNLSNRFRMWESDWGREDTKFFLRLWRENSHSPKALILNLKFFSLKRKHQKTWGRCLAGENLPLVEAFEQVVGELNLETFEEQNLFFENVAKAFEGHKVLGRPFEVEEVIFLYMI